jgi:hypothetical protein
MSASAGVPCSAPHCGPQSPTPPVWTSFTSANSLPAVPARTAAKPSISASNRSPPCFTQNSLTAGIDPLIALEWLPVPHHIKITVDGTEPKIPVEVRQTVERLRPKSMLAETYGNLDAHPAIVNTRLDTSFE